MREIKFKSYVKKEGKIESIIWCPFNEDRSSPDFDAPVKGDLLAYGLQFTGLKDKNRKDIYESDKILRIKDGIEGVVFFQYGAWRVKVDGSIDSDLHHWICYAGGSEVVGNIYENPELVTPK